MKYRHRAALLTALLLCTLIVPAAAAEKKRAAGNLKAVALADATARLSKVYTAEQLQKGVYVGAQFCLMCHQKYATQRDTNHSTFVRRPLVEHSLVPGKGVIADYDANQVDDFIQGLDFNKISSGFDAYKPSAPILSVENGTYYITVGTLKMPLVLTVAGQRNGSAQRYVVKIPVVDTPNGLSAANYFAPLQYTPGTGWAAYSPNNWYDATTRAPRLAAGIGAAGIVGPSNHMSGCAGCHMTAVKEMAKTAQGETIAKGYTAILYEPNDPSVFDYDYDGNFELMNIQCEDCHGPGSQHLIAAGNPEKIVNPARLKPAQQAEICGRCHVTGKSVPAGSFNWPYNDATKTNWTPFEAKAGIPLADFYQDTATYWPDGKHPTGGRPYNAYKISLHATFQYHVVGCPECHDPHEEGEGMLIRESMVADNLTIPTAVEDNSLCISCHAKYGPFAELTKQDVADFKAGDAEAYDKVATVTEKHTHHPFAPERMMGLSRCTGCHMVGGMHYWTAISPEETLKYQEKGGMTNSCAAGCHNNKVDIFNVGVKGTASGWANPFDVKLSKALKVFFGEGGIWWNTAGRQ
jgi:hypothetical protein